MFRIKFKLPRMLRRESRRAERIPILDNLILDYKNQQLSLEGSGEGIDFSTTGVCFAADVSLAEGTLLDLTLRFIQGSKPAHTIRAMARVVHCAKRNVKKKGNPWSEAPYYRASRKRKYHLGCEFVHLDPQTQEQIQSFCNRLKRTLNPPPAQSGLSED